MISDGSSLLICDIGSLFFLTQGRSRAGGRVIFRATLPPQTHQVPPSPVEDRLIIKAKVTMTSFLLISTSDDVSSHLHFCLFFSFHFRSRID